MLYYLSTGRERGNFTISFWQVDVIESSDNDKMVRLRKKIIDNRISKWFKPKLKIEVFKREIYTWERAIKHLFNRIFNEQ